MEQLEQPGCAIDLAQRRDGRVIERRVGVFNKLAEESLVERIADERLQHAPRHIGITAAL